MIGRHIGRYRILEELGTGGMSVVYKGFDTALDREVAVKVLHPHLAGKEESRRRLAREAKAVAKLHHPNILEVFDFAGSDAEEAYIVTEYIRGRTLRQCAVENLLDPPEIAAMVVYEIATALAHAHEAGIIHRDMKPENVMVREDGVLKLMDFGIAKIIDRDDRMTMTGALVGSPAHMAPEIIEGHEAGAEADVFSLGTMLYFFATGRLPFSGPNTTATLKKILDGIYDDPRQIKPSVSDDLAEIIATCLARQPTDRYPHAGKLRDALGAYLGGLGLSRMSEELVSFFADPPSYRKQLIPRLVERLVKRGEEYLADKRPAKALAHLNQVLALQEDNPRALELLQLMNVSRQRRRRAAWGLRASIGAGAAAIVVVAALRAYAVLTEPADFEPGGLRLTEVILPAALFPDPPKPPPLEEPRIAPHVAEPEHSGKPVTPSHKATDDAKRVARNDPPPGPGKVTIAVLFPTFGTAKFDTGEASPAEPHKMYELKVTPGEHQVTVGCGHSCEDYTVRVVVPPSGGEVALVPHPRPIQLTFNYEPSTALVSVLLPESAEFEGAPPHTRSLSKTVSETTAHPFVIRPLAGLMGVHLKYEISSPGLRTETGPLDIEGGGRKTVSGNLDPK